jgi:hypothetical protein
MRGDAATVPFPASQSYPFEKGDVLYIHPSDGTLRPAASMGVQAGNVDAQLAVAANCVGVAWQKNGLPAGDSTFRQNQNFDEVVLVATGGDWEFDCPAQNFTSGQQVGMHASGGSIPDSQTVDALQGNPSTTGGGNAPQSQSIGIAVVQVGSQIAALNSQTTTRVVVRIRPNYSLGGTLVNTTATGTSGQ